jgi:hypothetical protein
MLLSEAIRDHADHCRYEAGHTRKTLYCCIRDRAILSVLIYCGVR